MTLYIGSLDNIWPASGFLDPEVERTYVPRTRLNGSHTGVSFESDLDGTDEQNLNFEQDDGT